MEDLYYAVKVEGKIVSPLCESHAGAIDFKQHLPENQKKEAEVVRVTKDGKELLLG